jgi:hypothetical protein
MVAIYGLSAYLFEPVHDAVRGHSRWVLSGGATRLDDAPLWALAGLALERVHDAMVSVTVAGR